jgi:glyoxylase-like metal-dependent hydrolase (beta-lactamase superfamily II)
MRILRPADNLYAFYDGRLDDAATEAEGPAWVEGTLACGIASYAVVSGNEALIYDTQISLDRAELVRRTLEEQGVEKFTVLLSHWHLDHIAGNAAFADCELLASRRTHELLSQHRDAIEAGSQEGPPGIKPLVMPTRLLEGRTSLNVGGLALELIPADIHSEDAVVVWLPERRLLLAGDTVEDPITYVMEPTKLEVHLVELDRLAALRPHRIFPSHGHPTTIAEGGYSDGLIRATQTYIRALLRIRDEPSLKDTALRDLIAGPLDAGWISYFPRYEEAHQDNLRSVVGDSDGLDLDHAAGMG